MMQCLMSEQSHCASKHSLNIHNGLIFVIGSGDFIGSQKRPSDRIWLSFVPCRLIIIF